MPADYLVKPYDLRTLLATLQAALVNNTARRSVESQTPPADGLVGESPALLQVRELMEVYADSDAPVMVTGESGTGKELVARGIHRLSHRATAPFVAVKLRRDTGHPRGKRAVRLGGGGIHRRRLAGRLLRARPTAVRCSSTRWGKCPWIRRSSCCGRWRITK